MSGCVLSMLAFSGGVGLLVADAVLSRRLDRRAAALRAEAKALEERAAAQAQFHQKLMGYRDLLLDARARMDLDREVDRLWGQS